MASRNLHDLVPSVATKAKQIVWLCAEYKVDLLIYCTYRTVEEQARLYRNGRSLPAIRKKAMELERTYGRKDLAEILMDVGPQYGDRIVTWAGPGQSMHNYRLAFDAVPIVDGKLQWAIDATEWRVYGRACKEVGLEWAGTWVLNKREFPHAQDVGVSWKDLIEDFDHA